MGRRRRKRGDDDDGNVARRMQNVVWMEVEEITLAILDMHESHHQRAPYTHDDRIALVEAVRNAVVVVKNGKMLDDIFEILRTGMSMESATASYQLLCELESDFLEFASPLDKRPIHLHIAVWSVTLNRLKRHGLPFLLLLRESPE